jgi:hypothetical protein
MGMGHWAMGMGHGAWGNGHGAWGMGHGGIVQRNTRSLLFIAIAH